MGGGVVDRLREVGLGHTRLVAFVAGGKAKAPNYFVNRLAEVWWAMRNAYVSGALDTEDDAALIGQVSSREYTVLTNGRTLLQGKGKMHRSPDEADALAMTFAAPRGGNRIWT